jgi:predicted RNA-binding Zn-ribbon protein involved in translation (DUF1610 family)
MEIATVL